jgi:serine/threonine protein kinase
MHDNAVTEEIFNSEVAVKLFKGEVTSDGDPQDELKACITAGFHPNLVSIMAEVDGVNEQNISQKGLVMNLIPNHFFNLGQPPTLESCTRDHFDSKLSLSLKHLVKILLKVTDALQHLHEKQLCHGDLYAHNILIDHDASVLLSDFGAASHFSHLARHQQSALQAIEQRALGHLLEDLLKVCNDASSAPRVFEELRKTHLQLIGSNSPNEPKLTLSEFKFQLLDILASLELLE